MYTFITTGTYEYLKHFEDRHSEENITLMQNIETTLLWHETTGSSIFQSPRKYEVINSVGDIAEHGFVTCNNIPVSDEGRPVFEYEVTDRPSLVEKASGFLASRVLRPLSSDTYIVMTMWRDHAAFEAWKNTDAYKVVVSKLMGVKSTASTSIFSGSAYLSTYIVDEDELEQED
ncbi:antibiotic biosynthesis monooxygenase family protein [Bacillus sp. FSL K6-3431]|uniref:antibiotic biosynthesis monooxygenase family protein n=1 Tax=Bacillus sp. FSL K6-3431 TaxID=2921500 RepID=UPI0030FD01DA